MADVLENLQKLPPLAFMDNAADKSPGAPPVIAVRRGEMGYFPIFTKLTAAELNEREGVTPLQAEAMHNGSMFGWECKGADVDYLAAELKQKEAAAR